MNRLSSRLLVLSFLSLFLATWSPPCHADIPLFADSFQPHGPDHQPGSPVNGARLERGHGRWKSTSGLYFDDGKVGGGGVAEYARFSFFPEQHQRSARVYFDARVTPGSNGWSGIGFTNGDDGPLPTVGQLWMKLDDAGRIEVRANGAANLLFKDSHTNPAFLEGSNRIRFEYNRRSNTARVWLNNTELPLADLDKSGFVPDIRAAAFQIRDDSGELKTKAIGGGGVGDVTVGLADSLIGDQFNVVLPNSLGHHEGDPLNGVATQFGNETWYATANTGFGPGYASNIALGDAVGLARFDPDDYPGYPESSVEAIVNPGDADWVGLGFSSNANGSLGGSGTIWVQLSRSGVVRVRVRGTSLILYDSQHLDPGVFVGGLPVKLTFNRLTGATRVDFGETGMEIPSINVTVPAASLPLGTLAAGFQAGRVGGFTATNQFAVDDFAVRLSGEILPLEITEQPADNTQFYGGLAEFHCAAGGGVAPYSYRWQEGRFGGVVDLKSIDPSTLTWDDIAPDTPGFSGIDTQDLVIGPVVIDHGGYYRCVATDSNSFPSEVASGNAYLSVSEPLVSDSFTTGGLTGRVSGTPMDGLYSEDGNAVWSASLGAVLGDGILTNQPAGAQVLAEVPVTELMDLTYGVISTSANVVVGDADWIGVGFSTSTLESFFAVGSGLLWARVTNEGRVVVLADGTVLFAQYILTPQEVAQPVLVRVEYDSANEQPRVLVNNLELALNSTSPLGQFEAAGINAGKSGGFIDSDSFAIDDFALSGLEAVPPPTFDVVPDGQLVRLGADVTLTFEVSGGVPPYAIEWSRAFETITTDETFSVTVAPDGTSSSLTISNCDPSLDGYYKYTVVDSRYGDPRPTARSAWVYTELPDFGVLWGGRADDPVHIAEAYEPGSSEERAEFLRTNHTLPYKLAVDLRVDSAPDASVTYPLNIWGACHPAGERPSLPYSYLGATTLSGESGHLWVEFDVPEGCLGGSSWAILTLFVDINAEENPNAHDPYAYPDYIEYGQEHIPEVNFGIDNRGQLTAWIPVIDGANYSTLIDAVLQGASSSQGYEVDFVSSSDAPKPAGYLTDWVTSLVQSNEYHDYLGFHLKPWNPCVYIDDAIPNPKVDVPPSDPDYDPHTYQPYMAWDTLKDSDNFTPIGGLTRHRIENAVGRSDNSLFLGYSQGAPPTPSVDLTPAESGDPTNPVNAAVLGPDASPDNGGDSTNWLSWGNQLQYHVLVWDINHNSELDDGKGKLEEAFFPEAQPMAGTNTWVYLGFVKDGQTTWGDQIPCSMFDLEWYSLDAIRIWGVGGEDPPDDPIDHNALHFVTGDPSQGWTELPDAVLEDSEHRVCLLVKTTPASEPQPPLAEYRVGTSCNGADPQYGEILSTTQYAGGADGVYAYCPHDGGQPYYHLFSDPGIGCQHAIKGCTPGGDVNQANDCEVTSIDVISGCPVPAVDLP